MKKQLLTETDIIDNFKKKYEGVLVNDLKTAASEIPNVIMQMENNYKSIRGSEKKRLVVMVIISLMSACQADENEIELIKEILPGIIDGIVHVVNFGSDIFKKVKKSKCCM